MQLTAADLRIEQAAGRRGAFEQNALGKWLSLP